MFQLLGSCRNGSFGEAAIFSFYPTKNMTVCGDGGMVTTNNKKIYESVIKMRGVGRLTSLPLECLSYIPISSSLWFVF